MKRLDLSLPVLKEELPYVYSVDYRPALAARIVNYFTEGKTLQEISKIAGMPSYATLMSWLKDKAEFRDAMKAVRETRALHFEDMVIETALSADSLPKDDVPGARLKIESLMWAAEKADPSLFGKRTVVSGDGGKPVQIHVVTGFPPLSDEQKPPKLGAGGMIEKVIEEATLVTESEQDAPILSKGEHDALTPDH